MRWRTISIAAMMFMIGLGLSAAVADSPMSGPDVQRLAQRIIPAAKDPKGWGEDIGQALQRNGIAQTKSNVCSVMAVIEQESTFTANPQVKGLGRMAESEIKAKLGRIPVASEAAVRGVEWYLDNRPTPEKSYLKLIRTAKTERDLDLVYRNLAFFLFKEYATTGLLNSAAVAHRVDAENPVTTLGSMQVSVAFAIAEVETAKETRLQMSAIWKLRDELYTRSGGVNYGARMLLGYYAGYPSRLYVFADYNAGRYASRNAAFQSMVATLSGAELALDGDVLIYKGGAAASQPSGTEKAIRSLKLGLGDSVIRADLMMAKDYGFRDTATYRRVTERYTEATGKAAPYAAMPQIRLASPKLSHTMTTEKFARAVMARYDKCMAAR